MNLVYWRRALVSQKKALKYLHKMGRFTWFFHSHTWASHTWIHVNDSFCDCVSSWTLKSNFFLLQGLRKWFFFFNLALTDRNMQVKFGLKRVLELWHVDIFDTTISFYWNYVACHLFVKHLLFLSEFWIIASLGAIYKQ